MCWCAGVLGSVLGGQARLDPRSGFGGITDWNSSLTHATLHWFLAAGLRLQRPLSPGFKDHEGPGIRFYSPLGIPWDNPGDSLRHPKGQSPKNPDNTASQQSRNCGPLLTKGLPSLCPTLRWKTRLHADPDIPSPLASWQVSFQ